MKKKKKDNRPVQTVSLTGVKPWGQQTMRNKIHWKHIQRHQRNKE